MRAFALSLTTFAVVASARQVCNVVHGGDDDGPAIIKAFQQCAKNGRVTLDKFYSVNSVLLTTGLDDVEIELSGTGASEQDSTR